MKVKLRSEQITGKQHCWITIVFPNPLQPQGAKQVNAHVSRVHLKISCHLNSVPHYEEEGNLQPDQPISYTDGPALITSGSGGYIGCVWLKHRLHRIHPQTAQRIDAAAALERVERVRLPSAYLCKCKYLLDQHLGSKLRDIRSVITSRILVL